MDPMICQGVVRANKRPKAIIMALLQVLPISVIFFLFAYYRSCLPSFLQSIKLSFTATLGHFISKKAFFLLSNFILLVLAIDFNLCGSSAFMNNLCDEYLMRFGNHLLSQSHVVIPAKPRIVEENIVTEQSFTNNIYDDLFMQDDQPPFYEKYGGDATSWVRPLDVFQVKSDADKLSQGWLPLDNQPWQLNSAEVEDVAEEKDPVESKRDLEIAVVKEVIGEVKHWGRKDEFELLSIDELNHMFEEFINREKRNRRLEDLQLVMV